MSCDWSKGKRFGEHNVVRGANTLYMERGTYLHDSNCEIKTIASSMPFFIDKSLANIERIVEPSKESSTFLSIGIKWPRC